MNPLFSRLRLFFPRRKKLSSLLLVLAMPASLNYELHDFNYGGGGLGSGLSAGSNYRLNATVGEQNASTLNGSTYKLGPGLEYTQQANVPPAPTLSNTANYYNKLKIVISTGGNPADTLFAVAISSDGFSSDTRYVQSDNTVGAALGIEDYRTYASWGSATGVFITGLASSTTYTVKAKAWQGRFTETGYGPTDSEATVAPSFTFDIDVSDIDEDNSVTSIDFGTLTAGTVTDSPDKIWVDFITNGESGGNVYVSGSQGGLRSTAQNYLISAVTGNLTALTEGFGEQTSTATNGLSEATFYDLTGNSVGVTDTTIRQIFTATAPTTSGRGSFLLKAKSSALTPAAGDYQETLTVIAAASF